MSTSNIFPELSSDDSADIEPGIVRRVIQWLFGPGNLGMLVGLLFGAAVIVCWYWFSAPDWQSHLIYRFVIGPFAGFCGGGIGGAYARDEFLRPDWARSRALTALVSGGTIGAFVGLILCDVSIAVAGAVGGAVGAIVDAIVHRKTLEDMY